METLACQWWYWRMPTFTLVVSKSNKSLGTIHTWSLVYYGLLLTGNDESISICFHLAEGKCLPAAALSLGHFLWHISEADPLFDVCWIFFLISSLIWLMIPHNVIKRCKKIDGNPLNFKHDARGVSRKVAGGYFKRLKKSLIADMLFCLESWRTHKGFWEVTSPHSGQW